MFEEEGVKNCGSVKKESKEENRVDDGEWEVSEDKNKKNHHFSIVQNQICYKCGASMIYKSQNVRMMVSVLLCVLKHESKIKKRKKLGL